jgi:hypothetical protein
MKLERPRATTRDVGSPDATSATTSQPGPEVGLLPRLANFFRYIKPPVPRENRLLAPLFTRSSSSSHCLPPPRC